MTLPMKDLLDGFDSQSGMIPALRLKPYDDGGMCLLDHYPRPPAPDTPSDWFCYHFPVEAGKYGPPILERECMDPDCRELTIPLAPNIDFFAALLGHEKCRRTVWHKYEQQWYCRNPKSKYYEPASEEELKLALSQCLVQCCQAMSRRVYMSPLFNEFRSDEMMEQVLRRAKAVLLVDNEYFSPKGPNARNPALVPQESVRMFVDQGLVSAEEALLTFHDCFEAYGQFCQAQRLPGVARSQFRSAATPHIKRRFNIGVRHDLHRFEADKCMGWRGIRLLES